jgi:hypothetical protein
MSSSVRLATLGAISGLHGPARAGCRRRGGAGQRLFDQPRKLGASWPVLATYSAIASPPRSLRGLFAPRGPQLAQQAFAPGFVVIAA